MKITNKRAIQHRIENASSGRRHFEVLRLKARVSTIKVAAAATKKMVMFIKSGDLPNMPLYV